MDPALQANLAKAWGHLYLARLDASIGRTEVEAAKATTLSADASHPLPEFLTFPQLDLPDSAQLPWGQRTFAKTFVTARDLFNQAMPKLKEALAYFKLDGWVTEHIEILCEMSKAYGCARHLS
jgi:KIF-1 binding protein C terminal